MKSLNTQPKILSGSQCLPLRARCLPGQASGRPFSPLHGQNPWPSQISGFADALKTYIRSMQGLGAAILKGIALGLQLPPDVFAGGFAAPENSYWVRLLVILYPSRGQGYKRV